jgi:hypothetical protein
LAGRARAILVVATIVLHGCIGSVRKCDCLIVVIEKSQHVLFEGRRECRLTTACKNDNTNEWLCLHGRLLLRFLSMKPTPSKAKEFASVTALKEVYDGEMLISEVESRPAQYDFAERMQR